VNTPAYPNERRAARRITATCNAELTASLSILDASEITAESIVFFGRTIDLSPRGIGLVIPSVHLDERYFGNENRQRLAVHFPNGPVSFEVNAVRCLPLDKEEEGQGCVVGTRILRVLKHEDYFVEYLNRLENAN
jgi:hypothetical protein